MIYRQSTVKEIRYHSTASTNQNKRKRNITVDKTKQMKRNTILFEAQKTKKANEKKTEYPKRATNKSESEML